MSAIHITNETVHAKIGEKPSPETFERLKAKLVATLDEYGIDGDERAKALADLDKLVAESQGKTVEELSAESVACAMETTSERLDTLARATITLAQAFAKRGKDKESFQIGDVHGMLSAAQSTLRLAALSLRHVYGCDCHDRDEDEASKAETVPPPAPARVRGRRVTRAEIIPTTPDQASEWIALGWERLRCLLIDEGRAVHAAMVASWGITIERDTGAPCGWMMAINIGAMPEHQWGIGVAICRDAVRAEDKDEAAYLKRLARKTG